MQNKKNNILLATVITIILLIVSTMVIYIIQSSTPTPKELISINSCMYDSGTLGGTWACGIRANATAICSSGGLCPPLFCHYPPTCNSSEINIIKQNSTEFIQFN